MSKKEKKKLRNHRVVIGQQETFEVISLSGFGEGEDVDWPERPPGYVDPDEEEEEEGGLVDGDGASDKEKPDAIDKGANLPVGVEEPPKAKDSKKALVTATSKAPFGRERLKDPTPLQGDRDTVLELVRTNGLLLQFVPEPHRSDEEVVRVAVENSGLALAYAVETYRNVRDIVLLAVANNGHALEFAAPPMKKDVDIVKQAVTTQGLALQYADPKLQNSRTLVALALRSDGNALQFASDELRKDQELVRSAILRNPSAARHAHEELQNNALFIFEAMREHAFSVSKQEAERFRKMRAKVTRLQTAGNAGSKHHTHRFQLSEKELELKEMLAHEVCFGKTLQKRDKETWTTTRQRAPQPVKYSIYGIMREKAEENQESSTYLLSRVGLVRLESQKKVVSHDSRRWRHGRNEDPAAAAEQPVSAKAKSMVKPFKNRPPDIEVRQLKPKEPVDDPEPPWKPPGGAKLEHKKDDTRVDRLKGTVGGKTFKAYLREYALAWTMPKPPEIDQE